MTGKEAPQPPKPVFLHDAQFELDVLFSIAELRRLQRVLKKYGKKEVKLENIGGAHVATVVAVEALKRQRKKD